MILILIRVMRATWKKLRRSPNRSQCLIAHSYALPLSYKEGTWVLRHIVGSKLANKLPVYFQNKLFLTACPF